MNSLPQFLEAEPLMKTTDLSRHQGQGGRLPLEDMQKRSEVENSRKQLQSEKKLRKNEQTHLSNGFDLSECPPPKTENEV